MKRLILALALALASAACKSEPLPPPALVGPAPPSFEMKMAWILRLEDQRVLRDPVLPPAPAPPPAAAPPGRKAPAATPAPPPAPPPPDLLQLLGDDDARIRRRAALAVGRVGLAEGVDPLMARLADPDPEVRQMAAFALGLLGDTRARDALVQALSDASLLVQASAAEALGLIGDPAAGPPLGALAARIVESGALASVPSEAEVRRDTPAGVFRLAVLALARLKAYGPLAAAVLDAHQQPRVRWWPVAYALQQIADARALPALKTLAGDSSADTRALAVRGLGALKDRSSVALLAPLAAAGDRATAIEAVRALGRIGDPAAGGVLLKILQDRRPDPHLRLEAITAAGATKAPGAGDLLVDLLADPSPAVRAAALRAAAEYDPDGFVTILSGLDPDPDWRVRSALASVLGTLPPDRGLPRLRTMLKDADQRVIPSVLRALVALGAPDAPRILMEELNTDDPAVRAAAAEAIGELKPEGGAAALAAAYRRGQADPTHVARAAAIGALARYRAADLAAVLDEAIVDRDWAVRVLAAAAARAVDPTGAGRDIEQRIRPAPVRIPVAAYATPRLIAPEVSTQAYLDTDRGTIQIELAVLDAPLAVENFVQLARSGFFNGVSVHRVVPDVVVETGDPRGDGWGGPGYTVRDELSERPFVRGTVGLARDGAETGGSRFFVTLTPQPELDARAPVIGRVVAGMEVLDALQAGDVVQRVRIWDGQTPPDPR